MQSKSVLFKIKYCNEDAQNKSKKCKKREEIDDFIDEMTVQLWVIESSIDMRFFHGESFARNQRLLSENKIRNKDEIPNQIMFIGQKNYKSFERLFGEKD